MNIDELAKEIHANNVAAGWWDGDVCLITKVHLITTEICEATEGMRKDLMDDHLPHRKMEEVELADALIRTLDLGGKLHLEFSAPTCKTLANCEFKNNHADAEQHFDLVAAVYQFGMSIRRVFMIGLEAPFPVSLYYSLLVTKIINESVRRGFDIEAAMREKLTYNKQRADHKPENRVLANGKKF